MYVECKIIQTSLGNYIFQTITSIFCHNISINKCLANSFTQHDTHFSTSLYFVMAEYIAKGDHHFHNLCRLIKRGENTGSKYDSSITGSFLCKIWKHQRVAPCKHQHGDSRSVGPVRQIFWNMEGKKCHRLQLYEILARIDIYVKNVFFPL